jgi:hypothetical protein
MTEAEWSARRSQFIAADTLRRPASGRSKFKQVGRVPEGDAGGGSRFRGPFHVQSKRGFIQSHNH